MPKQLDEWTDVTGLGLTEADELLSKISAEADELAVAEGHPCLCCGQPLSFPVREGMHSKCVEALDDAQLEAECDAWGYD